MNPYGAALRAQPPGGLAVSSSVREGAAAEGRPYRGQKNLLDIVSDIFDYVRQIFQAVVCGIFADRC